MILAALFIVCLVSPTVSAFTRTAAGYPTVFAIYIAWFVTCIMRAKKSGKKFLIDKTRIAEVVAMVAWLLVASLTFVFGRGENGYWALIYTIMFMTVYMIDYLYSIYNEQHVIRGLVYALVIKSKSEVFLMRSILILFLTTSTPTRTDIKKNIIR
jgi:hypothetical protein